MTNEEILKKAIEKASQNGYPRADDAPMSSWKSWVDSKNYYRTIFSHDFAKAFWGEEPNIFLDGDFKVWQYHLREMVLEEEPLKYLEKFL